MHPLSVCEICFGNGDGIVSAVCLCSLLICRRFAVDFLCSLCRVPIHATEFCSSARCYLRVRREQARCPICRRTYIIPFAISVFPVVLVVVFWGKVGNDLFVSLESIAASFTSLTRCGRVTARFNATLFNFCFQQHHRTRQLQAFWREVREGSIPAPPALPSNDVVEVDVWCFGDCLFWLLFNTLCFCFVYFSGCSGWRIGLHVCHVKSCLCVVNSFRAYFSLLCGQACTWIHKGLLQWACMEGPVQG